MAIITIIATGLRLKDEQTKAPLKVPQIRYTYLDENKKTVTAGSGVAGVSLKDKDFKDLLNCSYTNKSEIAVDYVETESFVNDKGQIFKNSGINPVKDYSDAFSADIDEFEVE